MAYIDVEISVPVTVRIHSRPVPQPGEFVRGTPHVAEQQTDTARYSFVQMTFGDKTTCLSRNDRHSDYDARVDFEKYLLSLAVAEHEEE